MSRLHRDRRGAVLVEFLIALMPLMITFFCFTQVAQIATARLVVKHSTIVGARAAAVISNVHRNTPDQKADTNQQEIEQGVKVAMGPWLPTMKTVTVKVDDASSCDDPYGAVRVTVDVDYRCNVPLASLLLCAKGGGTTHLAQSYAMAHQGARYAEGGGASCN